MSSQTERLKKYDLQIRGHLGQHFLVDPNIQKKIVEMLPLEAREPVIEIGPGVGALTDRLLEKGVRLWAIEKDERFLPVLKEEIGALFPTDFHLIHDDVLRVSFRDIAREAGVPKIKVIGNLPYYITAPILVKLVEEKNVLSAAVVMIQKEVADRLLAKPRTKEYGRLTLLMNYSAVTTLAFKVPAGCFTPKPAVDSAVLLIEFRQRDEVIDEAWLFRLIQISFSQRRKTLAHLLANDIQVGAQKKDIQDILVERNFQRTARGEELAIEDFIYLAQKIRKKS